jgi:hypothetical protein
MNQFVSQPLPRDPMRDQPQQLVHQVQRVPCRGSKGPFQIWCTAL